MLDRKYLRDHPEEARARLALRGGEFAGLVDEFLANDSERRSIQAELDELRAQKNTVSKQIGEFMKAGEREKAEVQKVLSSQIGNAISDLEDKSRA
ncbi:MAG TPA: serine--tRNA ligase, partial [Firmicutes bacterium]|nr:serine--tRNA ligase [Bacillota bacterium]